MTIEEALEFIDSALGRMQGSRSDHLRAVAAVQTVRDALAATDGDAGHV